MRFQHVCLEAVAYTLPEDIVSSVALEERLAPVYERLNLRPGRIELMTGIRERRFYAPGVKPGEVSAQTARLALEAAGVDPQYIGALIHGSVCRDQMEPATANFVHATCDLPAGGVVYDVSNACLGLLNGAIQVANMIELGQIRAGLVVGTEVGRSLVEGTIDSLLADETLTRQSIKPAFTSLTIGSGSAALLLCDASLSQTSNRLLGGRFLADTASHHLCAGGVEPTKYGDSRPRMETDSEALLHAGVDLAKHCWETTKDELGWSNESVDRTVTHQVGKAHRKKMLAELGLAEEIDFPTVEVFGNTGAVALPLALGLASEQGKIQAEQNVALLGIGSGLNSLMLGLEVKQPLRVQGQGTLPEFE